MTDTQINFITEVSKYVKKYAPQFNICVYSPIIAQAILESNWGKSDKVQLGNNYFGLKWRNNRCLISNEYFVAGGSEQNADGTYVASNMKWCKFNSLEECIIGYFQWTNIPSYKNLKGVMDPKVYLENIKEDKYATSLKYVDNLMNVIYKYKLLQYDNKMGEKSMILNVHAGHNPDGKIACGAVGLLKESTEARLVKDKVIKMLREQGHTVYDCTVNDGKNQNNVLSKIVSKCNQHKVDYDISIHFNSGAKNMLGNKKTTGTEVLIYSSSSKSKQVAQSIVNSISELGYKNRGVKFSKSLYFLRKTKSPALLVECAFVDDLDDVKIYSVNNMANAIVKGITGCNYSINDTPNKDNSLNPSLKFLHNGIDYSLVFDPLYYANKYSDLKATFGTNAHSLFYHFISNGMKEGRQGISTFNVTVYKNLYSDLRTVFGTDLPAYYCHYITNGHSEKRKAI